MRNAVEVAGELAVLIFVAVFMLVITLIGGFEKPDLLINVLPGYIYVVITGLAPTSILDISILFIATVLTELGIKGEGKLELHVFVIVLAYSLISITIKSVQYFFLGGLGTP